MTEQEIEIEHRLTDVEARSKSNTRRLDAVEENQKILSDLATGVSVMGTKIDNIKTTVNKLDGKVSEMEGKAGKRWESMSEKVIWAIVAAVITYILSHVGL